MTWPSLPRSLFVKIYLTVLASLAVVAVASALFVWIGQDERDRGWAGRRDQFLAAMLPPGTDPRAQQAVLDRLAAAFDADIELYDPAGRLIASSGGRGPEGQPARRAMRRMMADMRPFHHRLPDGRVIEARLGMPLGPGGGNPLGYIAMVALVTGLAAYPVVRHLTRRLETLRRGVERFGEGALVTRVPVHGHDEIAAVARSFNEAAARIERLVASHASLLANASHELRSPLARLRMAVDMHQSAPNGAGRSEIVRNLGELDELVEEILLASRLDHGGETARSEPVDLLALAAEEGARDGVAASGAPAVVHGDPKLLRRLVRNLVQNALRHGARPVDISVAQAPGQAELRVRDHGPGIAPADAERVFEPFYRPAGRAESAGGWGLGLSLVRQIARRHGGTARYEAAAGGGACFVVTLPGDGRHSPTGQPASGRS